MWKKKDDDDEFSLKKFYLLITLYSKNSHHTVKISKFQLHNKYNYNYTCTLNYFGAPKLQFWGKKSK